MELWTRAGRLEGASCSRRLSNKPMLYLNICCFLCRRHEVLPGNPKKVTITTFASGVICGKSILINPLIRERVAWATDGTKLLVKSICETAPKPLFWDLNWPLIGLLKNGLSICQSTWREIRSAFPVIPLGDKNKDIGAASQTLLTGVRLRLWHRLSEGYFLLPEIIARLTLVINHSMSNKLRRWKPRKVWHLVRRPEGSSVLSDGNKENLSSFKHKSSECRTSWRHKCPYILSWKNEGCLILTNRLRFYLVWERNCFA